VDDPPRADRGEEEGAVRRLALVLAVALAAACAQQSFPPGGPPRHTPPVLDSVSPESGTVNFRGKSVIFKFDEVVSERPAGTAQNLSGLILISPRDGEPRVGWHRDRIDVRGQRPWKPITAYTVTLRPGLADLHGNVLRRPVVIVFSTGSFIPATLIHGAVFDYATGNPVPNALVQVFVPPDSTQYITLADSSGRYQLGTMRAGPVTIRGVADLNTNRDLDPREPFDTVTINLTDTVSVDIYAFVHDSIGPRITGVEIRDSLAIKVTFDKPVLVSQTLDTTNFLLRTTADSMVVPIRVVRPWRDYDKERTDSLLRADSITGKRDTAAIRKRKQDSVAAALKDTVPHVPPPVPKRALANTEFLIAPAAALVPGTWYRVDARNVKNLLGDTASSFRTVQFPKPLAKDTTKAGLGRDSTGKLKGIAPPAPPPVKPPSP
jgi:hypothetical protein